MAAANLVAEQNELTLTKFTVGQISIPAVRFSSRSGHLPERTYCGRFAQRGFLC